ncbi:hypothetical protein [Porphyromonas macacae]|nr:hypothetical protein [Porphyromonas macacae]
MKTLKILLYGMLSLAVAAGIFALKCYLGPIEIYEMPINAWKRQVWDGPDSTQKEENYVIYNHLGKSEQQVLDSVMAFAERTMSIDTLKKYQSMYSRSFYKRDWTVNKHYKEELDGSDIIIDHGNRRICRILWVVEDEIANIYVGGKYYVVPISDSTWQIISSIRLLESNDQYLCYPKKSKE